jgi:hypothetical protein
LSLDEQPLCGALADTRHDRERAGEVVVEQHPTQRGRRVDAEDRERELRADTTGADEHPNGSFVARRVPNSTMEPARADG